MLPLNPDTKGGRLGGQWESGGKRLPAGADGSNCSCRPPGDNFENANTAAAEPNIAGQTMTPIKLITVKYATLMLRQKTQHPFYNVVSQNTVVGTEASSCSRGFTTSADQGLCILPPHEALSLTTAVVGRCGPFS